MNFSTLKKHAAAFTSVVRLDQLLGLSGMIRILRFLSLGIGATLLLVMVSLFTSLEGYLRYLGLVMFLLGWWLVVFAAVAYTFSWMIRSPDERIPVSFDAALIALLTDSYDLTAGFLASPPGRLLWRRLGLTAGDRESFYGEREDSVSDLELPAEEVTFSSYARALYAADPDWQTFLHSQGVSEEMLTAVAEWVERERQIRRNHWRWWRPERLKQIPSLGVDWHYGRTPKLDQFSREVPPPRAGSQQYYQEEADRLEEVLAKQRGSNALLISRDASGVAEAVSVLAWRVRHRSVTPELEFHRLRRLDTSALIAQAERSSAAKGIFLEMLNEAVRAGNVVLIVEHLPAWLDELSRLGLNGAELLEDYLKTPGLRFVFTSSPDAYHSELERDDRLNRWLEKITIEAEDRARTIRLLEDRALLAEAAAGGSWLVSFPAINAIYQSADQYMTEKVMPTAALDLLEEVAAAAIEQNRELVTASLVTSLVQDKTGIPMGEISNEEREKLLDLEELMHRRIVGQEQAVRAVSDALRRSRSGVADPQRPMGVFLFLGPTGVGKTETAKVLAETVFEGRDDMVRLDLSEFAGPKALSRLIGSRRDETAGSLAAAARDDPYSVLLLDEFEKAAPEVHDLFLRIFDEGVFHDGYDRLVDLRHMIIIATSNAVSSEIRALVGRGESLLEHRQELLDTLISSHSFRPELLNRFDDIVFFHPLSNEEARAVAERELAKLQARLNQRSISFEVTEAVLDRLVEQGYDEQFGARSIRRIIDSDIEKVISHKLITGEVSKGDTVVITEEDLASVESGSQTSKE